jgi:hypothetical protein
MWAYVDARMQLFQLEEKDTASKLDMLFSKNLYPMAISLATSANYDNAAIIEIYQKFGDHLYRSVQTRHFLPHTHVQAHGHIPIYTCNRTNKHR